MYVWVCLHRNEERKKRVFWPIVDHWSWPFSSWLGIDLDCKMPTTNVPLPLRVLTWRPFFGARGSVACGFGPRHCGVRTGADKSCRVSHIQTWPFNTLPSVWTGTLSENACAMLYSDVAHLPLGFLIVCISMIVHRCFWSRCW